MLTAQACGKKSESLPQAPPTAIAVKIYSPLTKKITDQTALIKTFKSDTLIQLTQGLAETIITYLNTAGQPMKMFILEADLNTPTLRLKAATPNNSTAFAKQTVPEIARTQDGVGNRVIAAINGDYFDAAGTPQSALYKNGVAVKPQFCDLCTFLSIDGQNKAAIVSKERTFDPLQIREAVGGYHWLIKNSSKVVNGDLSIEPRTAVGVTASNVVYFILVDGRQASYSNGISFAQLSDAYFALGVKDAINLDGGGSTTLAIKEGTGWTIKNKPSDGSPRAVANGWAIVDTR